MDGDSMRTQQTRTSARALDLPTETVYVFPLSSAQQQLWLLDRLLAGRAVYNVPLVMSLVGPLDTHALQWALQELVRRHEVLRTTFEMQSGAPVQVIAADLTFAIQEEDLRALPPAERESEARRSAQKAVSLPFDLAHGPLLRARLLRLDDQEHWLVMTLHHIITDGWSSGVMWRELSALYEAYRAGRPSPLPELAVQYADYAVWQREWLQSQSMRDQLGYWKKVLADLPALELPTDRTRPPVASCRGGRLVFALEGDLVQRLKTLAKRESATLFMTLLASFQVLLCRYSGQEDIAVGIPTAGRERAELDGVIGYFVNMLVLRGDLSGEPTFAEYLARVRERAVGAYAHPDLPFAMLVEELAPRRDPSRNPLFQVCFTLENGLTEQLRLGGVAVSRVDGVHTQTAKFDLNVTVTEAQGLASGTIEYATDLFDAATIERMIGHWRVLLEAIVADPQQRISRLPLLTDAERRQLLRNDAVVEYPRDRCLHQLFEAQVQRTPEAIAVVCEGEKLTYDELNARANRLAHHLCNLGVGPEVLVAIAMERSLDLVVALLGILKAGGAYVPLDPSYPAARLAFMLADTQAPVLLTQRRLLQQLPVYSGHAVCVDQDWPDIAAQPDTNPEPRATTDNLAYVIYTSGSTGQPKGTLVTHYNVTRLFAATERWFGFDDQDVWTVFHSFAFDFSVWEMWGALIYGGRLVLVPYVVSRNPEAFHALLVREGVTVLNQTPSAFRQLMTFDAKARGDEALALRLVIFGGEALDLRSLRPWIERHGDAKPRLVNMYGITETTVHVSYRPVTRRDVDAASGSMIGEPIPDLKMLLVDRHLQPVPAGIPGEILVGGAGVARGYLNRPELTVERFISDPLTGNAAPMYRSGDLARWTSTCDVEYLGRIDEQVKIRGFRIELGEIESILKQHEAIQDAVVVMREDRPGDKRLVAYIVHPRGCSLSPTDLRASLAGKLPEYMVPSAFVSVEALPLTVNGKVDRARLPACAAEVDAGHRTNAGPRNAVEVQLVQLWQQVLDVSQIGITDNFLDLGGDSLGAVRLVDRIEQLFGKKLPPDILWYRAGTIEQLARVLVHDGQLWSGPVPIKSTGTRTPLFCPHTVGGNLFFYDNVARHLHEDQPVYGLPARGIDGSEPPDSTIEAMAAHCIANMRRVQPEGPYRLAGYCSAAAIAYEMACQLRTDGETVDLLVLCDSLAPGFHARELMRVVRKAFRQRNWRSMQQRLYRLVLQNLGLSRLRKFRTVGEAHYWASLSYRPQPYPGRAVLIKASDLDYGRRPALGWEKLARGGVAVCVIPAVYGEIVTEPTVRVLAQRLETYLERADAPSASPGAFLHSGTTCAETAVSV